MNLQAGTGTFTFTFYLRSIHTLLLSVFSTKDYSRPSESGIMAVVLL
jgi:hypothetical protein